MFTMAKMKEMTSIPVQIHKYINNTNEQIVSLTIKVSESVFQFFVTGYLFLKNSFKMQHILENL